MITRQGVPYTGAALEQFEEAMRLIPAFAKLRHEGRQDDVAALMAAYCQEGLGKGVDLAHSWSILFAATQIWVDQLFIVEAKEDGVTVSEAIDRAISWAADWQTSDD